VTDAFYARSSSRASEDRIVRRIKALERRLDSAVRTPQLPSSAIDDGALTVTSGGTTTGIVGQQYDGTSAYVSTNGPVPPTPGPPLVVTVVGGLRVTVTGLFVDPQNGFSSPVVAPQDFHRWDVEVSTSPAFPEFADPMAPNNGSVLAASGGQIKVGWPTAGQLVYVRVRARTLSGKRSAPSDSVPVTTGTVGLGDLGFDLSTYVASNSVQYGTVLPSPTGYTGRIGTLFLLQTAAGPPPKYTTYRYTGAAWDALADQSASDALAAAVAAQQAADLKMRPFYQTTAPAYSGPADTAMWWDTDDGNRPYRWNGTAWADNRLGNGAIQPNSLVASNVVATGTITATLLQTVMVLTTAILAGDPTDEHSRLDSGGLRAYANDEGLPTEVGYFGRGFNVRNPDTGVVVGGITDAGDISGQTLFVAGDPSFAGTPLSQTIWNLPWGIQAYGKWPVTGANSALTNSELGFMELGFTAVAGRSYRIMVEPLQPVNVNDPGGWWFRIRYTLDGTAPTITSPTARAFSAGIDTSTAWNTMVPFFFLWNGPSVGQADQNLRMLLTYGVGTSTGASLGAGVFRGPNHHYFWVEDMGPTPPETGNESSGAGTASSGTAPPAGGTTTKQNYTLELAANWQRTWNQTGSIIADTEMQQGYGDSFNGIRRSAAGWTGLPTTLAGATITEVAFYIESYYSWNMSGGQVRLGTHGATAEPAAFPGSSNVTGHNYPQRSYGSWIVRNDLAAGVQSGAVRGISFLPPSTSSTYYMKFRGEGYGSGRPRIRVKYTK
jgi:hypothetical protein